MSGCVTVDPMYWLTAAAVRTGVWLNVDKHVDHVTWVGSYWRQDGAFEANVYEVEVKEDEWHGYIGESTYPVSVSFRLVKRTALYQGERATD